MRLLKVLIGLFIVLGLAYWLNQNGSQKVDIWLFPGFELSEKSLSTALVGTLALGILLGFLIGLVQIMSQQVVVRRQGQQLKKLRTELNTLRHSPLTVDLFEPGPEEPAAAGEPDESSEQDLV